MSTLPEPSPPLAVCPPLPAAARVAYTPRAPTPVTIADRVTRAFVPLACVRGFRYFRAKRVELVVDGERAVDATVKGKRVQRVRLRVEEGRLASACSCSPRLLGPAACKHVWATLLEIDRRGVFESLRKTSRSLPLGVIDAPHRPRRPKAAPSETAASVVAKPAPCKKSSAAAPRARGKKRGS